MFAFNCLRASSGEELRKYQQRNDLQVKTPFTLHSTFALVEKYEMEGMEIYDDFEEEDATVGCAAPVLVVCDGCAMHQMADE